MTAAAHAQAVLALLAPLASGAGPVPVYDGRSPNKAEPPYVIVDVEPALAEVDDLDGNSHRHTCTFQITGVGEDTRQARNVADRAGVLVLDVRPSVAGRQSGPVRQITSVPVRRDIDDPETWIATTQWRFVTVPDA